MFSFVIEDYKTKRITDFFSFYSLPKVHSKHHPDDVDYLKVCYAYYTVPKGHDLTTLMKLTLAKSAELDFDLFNAIDIMENYKYLNELKFETKESVQYFYTYNWNIAAPVHSRQVGIILSI